MEGRPSKLNLLHLIASTVPALYVNVLLTASLSVSISMATDADISNCFSETLSVNVVFNWHISHSTERLSLFGFNVPDGESVSLLFYF